MLCTDKSMTDYLNTRLFSRRFVPSGGCLTNILYPAYVRFMSDLSISADDFKFYRNNIYQDISFAELENRDTLTFFMLFNKKELLSAVGAMRAHASVNSADQLRQLTGFHAFSANSSCLDWLSRHYHLPLSKKRFPNTLKTIRISGLNDAQYDILADYLMETAEQIENILFNPYYPYRMILNSGSDNEFLFIDHINMP